MSGPLRATSTTDVSTALSESPAKRYAHANDAPAEAVYPVTYVATAPPPGEAATAAAMGLPGLVEGSHLGQEGPGVARLVSQVEDLRGDGGRGDEEVVLGVLEALARPRHVDHRVDDQIGDVNALGT